MLSTSGWSIHSDEQDTRPLGWMDSKVEDTAAEVPPAETSAAEPSSSKPRMKRPIKPDVEEHKAAVEQLQNEMQKRKARVDEIKQTIDQKRNFDGGPEFQKARSKLTQLSSSFKAQLVRFDALVRHESQCKQCQAMYFKPSLSNCSSREWFLCSRQLTDVSGI